jgi:hypothetical protein
VCTTHECPRLRFESSSEVEIGLVSVSFAFRFRACVLSDVEILVRFFPPPVNQFTEGKPRKKNSYLSPWQRPARWATFLQWISGAGV